MKNILFLTAHLPSLNAGGEKFTYLLIENLSKNNNIDLIYFKYHSDHFYTCPNSNVKVLRVLNNSIPIKLRNALQHPTIHPIFTIRFEKRLLKYIKNILKSGKYDLVYLDHSQMFMYGKYLPNIKKILMSHDIMAQRYARKGNFICRRLVMREEKSLMQLPNCTVFTFSEKDNDIVAKYYGVHTKATHFFLDKIIIDAIPNKIERRIILMGKWNRPDNLNGLIWFLNNVSQRLDKCLNIIIFGKWMPDKILKKIENLDNVEYLGFVKNPYSLIANSLAVISPLFSGAGVKVKVVEALACGTPVIGTDIAFEGILTKDNAFMKIASDADEYVRSISNLNISVEERKHFKQKFLQEYENQDIVSYINNL